MKVILVLLAFMTAAQAQGLSYIGLCNKTWPCDETLKSWRGQKTVVTGWLEDSFGKACPCADKILQTKKPKIIRVHLANGPCLRNDRCRRGDVFFGYTIASANRAAKNPESRLRKRLDRLAVRLRHRLEASKGSLTCYVSPCLECDLNGPARKALLDSVSHTVPSCVLVDNPLRASCLRGTVCERHGISPALKRPCISDLDGTEAKSKVDLKAFYRNTRECDIRFYWSAWMNCNPIGYTPRFVDPSARDCSHPVYKFKDAGRIAWKWL